jgi:hypothetical protein
MDRLILEKALENLEKNTGLKTQWDTYVKELDQDIDAKVTLKWDNHRLERYAEVKKEIRKHHVLQLKEIADKHKNFILIVERLYPNVKKALNEAGIDWLDAAGNVHLKDKNVYLWIEYHTTTPANKNKNRAFTKTGLKVLFLFLQDEKWLNKTYREIADQADVALGNIKHVLDGLKDLGYLINTTNKKKKLIKKEELLDQWLTAFNDELKPRLAKGNYRFRNKEAELNWAELNLDRNTCWGGEPAADLLTNDLKPMVFKMYTYLKRADLMKKFQFVPDEQGKIEIYEPYWKIEPEEQNIAPYLAIYTDLMITGDPRNMKTAEKIYERYIKNKA